MSSTSSLFLLLNSNLMLDCSSLHFVSILPYQHQWFILAKSFERVPSEKRTDLQVQRFCSRPMACADAGGHDAVHPICRRTHQQGSRTRLLASPRRRGQITRHVSFVDVCRRPQPSVMRSSFLFPFIFSAKLLISAIRARLDLQSKRELASSLDR